MELSVTDKAFVLEQISESEYELRREVLFTSRQVVEEESGFLTPDSRIASNLREAMTSRKLPNSIWDQIEALIKRPVPAYQFAIGIALLLVLFVWNNENVPAVIVYKDNIVYQEKHDTVYVDKPVIEIQTIEKVVTVVEYIIKGQQKAQEPVASYQSAKDRMEEAAAEQNTYAFTDQQIERNMEKSFGNSSVDTRELARLIGVLD